MTNEASESDARSRTYFPEIVVQRRVSRKSRRLCWGMQDHPRSAYKRSWQQGAREKARELARDHLLAMLGSCFEQVIMGTLMSRAREQMKYLIDGMKPEDWEQVRSIYLEGINTGNSTFEADAPEWEKWDSAHLPEHRLVIRAGNSVLAWTALSPVSSRNVYAGVAEFSLYVAAKHRGKGLGSALLGALIDSSEKAGIWTLQASIFPENAASLGMVKKLGFREIGRRERIGKMTHGDLAGNWRDTILVERRSAVTGID